MKGACSQRFLVVLTTRPEEFWRRAENPKQIDSSDDAAGPTKPSKLRFMKSCIVELNYKFPALGTRCSPQSTQGPLVFPGHWSSSLKFRGVFSRFLAVSTTVNNGRLQKVFPGKTFEIKKETFLLREIRDVEPYKFKRGTNETGQAWSEVADDVNQHEGFKVMPRYQRSVRDRFNKLLSDAERGGEGQEQILSLCLKQKLC
ncbi:uncharacterized protein LOC141860632 isoform X2 [Acropora palmata]|uniref:uncharacterized protein LOC141860632 isoform X2 n=1 Tax=Acropora palmata TaxID=6131 RepID=UPI003DA0DC9D